ncbi:hypothetical protein OG21DRAFT_1516110 [Imleria badia]|nr:hypothetical protein OG21DRAFT_1516110 [Imleria badia]
MFTALALLFLLQFAAAQSCNRTYTVQEGDICDSISGANYVSTYQLWAVNSAIIDCQCDNLQPGSVLCLGLAGEDCTNTYTVKAGDTCDSVSSTYGINTTILYANNPQLDQNTCDNLYVGEVSLLVFSCFDPP